MRTLTQGPYSVRYKGVDYIGVSVIVGCPQGGSWWYTIVPPGGVLGISSDGDDRRIFLGLKFLIPGFFWVRKFGKYFFG